MTEEMSRKLTQAIEEVSREHAAEIQFDMHTEHHALARMIMTVLSDDRLRRKALEKFKLKCQ